jgi:hypothetical protein
VCASPTEHAASASPLQATYLWGTMGLPIRRLRRSDNGAVGTRGSDSVVVGFASLFYV